MENELPTLPLHQFANKSKSYNAWIRVGYELFAHEGPEGLQIERLARILKLNKSGFYHYFGNPESYFEQLMNHHVENADLAVDKLRSIHNYMPECIQFMADFTIPMLAQMQLQRAGHIQLFAKTFETVNDKIDPAIIPLWADFIECGDYPALAARYFKLFRDLLYARIRPANLSFNLICDISIEAREISKEFKNLNSYVDEVISLQSA